MRQSIIAQIRHISAQTRHTSAFPFCGKTKRDLLRNKMNFVLPLFLFCLSTFFFLSCHKMKFVFDEQYRLLLCRRKELGYMPKKGWAARRETLGSKLNFAGQQIQRSWAANLEKLGSKFQRVRQVIFRGRVKKRSAVGRDQRASSNTAQRASSNRFSEPLPPVCVCL